MRRVGPRRGPGEALADLAAEQLEDGVNRLGLRGGSVGASIGTEELAARRFNILATSPRITSLDNLNGLRG